MFPAPPDPAQYVSFRLVDKTTSTCLPDQTALPQHSHTAALPSQLTGYHELCKSIKMDIWVKTPAQALPTWIILLTASLPNASLLASTSAPHDSSKNEWSCCELAVNRAQALTRTNTVQHMHNSPPSALITFDLQYDEPS